VTRFGGWSWAAALLLVGAAADVALRRPLSLAAAAHATQRQLLADLDRLHADVVRLQKDPAPPAFERARRSYKRVEGLIERISPGTAATLNGPPEPSVEEGAPSVVEHPEGFQVVELLLYGPDERGAGLTDMLRRELRVLEANVVRARRIAEATDLDAVNVFAAAREEIARVATLGIVDFDSPLAQRGAMESATALAGTLASLAPFEGILERRDPAVAAALRRTGARAVAKLGEPHLARLGFIAGEARAFAAALMAARDALHVASPGEHGIWRDDVASPFELGAFDPDGLAPRAHRRAPASRAELGQMLFSDPILSGDGRRSCASCHLPARAFADTTRGSPAVQRGTRLARNTPSLVNAALQPALFLDSRVAYLEDQIGEVIANPREMGGNLDTAARRLNGRRDYRFAFARAFGDSVATPARIRASIAAYLRTIVALDAPLDRAMRGDANALTPAERAGFDVFVGKGRCAGCHFLPLLGGVVPPRFTEVESEIIGVPDRWPRAAVADTDQGMARHTRADIDRGRFRTPLRGVALTAPYMHNGVMPTLESVVKFYDIGGGAGMGIPSRQTLPPDSLRLTTRERDALVAFLQSLDARGR